MTHPEVPARDSNTTILIVDDEADLREVLELGLQVMGVRTLSAESGESALKILDTTPVDVVVSDVRMPHGDGVFLLENMRKRHFDMPVVIMTGFADRSSAEFIAMGANDVLHKPFPIKELRRTVGRYAKRG